MLLLINIKSKTMEQNNKNEYIKIKKNNKIKNK